MHGRNCAERMWRERRQIAPSLVVLDGSQARWYRLAMRVSPQSHTGESRQETARMRETKQRRGAYIAMIVGGICLAAVVAVATISWVTPRPSRAVATAG